MTAASPKEEGRQRFLNKVRAPPQGPEGRRKEQMGKRVIDEEERLVIHGISGTYSHPLERGVDIEIEADVDRQRVRK